MPLPFSAWTPRGAGDRRLAHHLQVDFRNIERGWGCSFLRREGKYFSRRKVEGREVTLGRYFTREEALVNHDVKIIQMCGGFAAVKQLCQGKRDGVLLNVLRGVYRSPEVYKLLDIENLDDPRVRPYLNFPPDPSEEEVRALTGGRKISESKVASMTLKAGSRARTALAPPLLTLTASPLPPPRTSCRT